MVEGEQKQRQGLVGDFLGSIKGRIALMGGIAVVASIVLGYVGMNALNNQPQQWIVDRYQQD